jgi:hypothetical protein
MPPIFKALASIMVWTMWIVAWVMGFSILITGIARGEIYGPQAPPMSVWAGFAVTIGFALGSLIGMKIRKSLE